MDEIAGLFVSISADLSGLDAALQKTRITLEQMGAGGGLLGRLPLQTEQQAAQIVAGIEKAFAPLPDALRRGLEAPIDAALNRLEGIVSARVNGLLDGINAAIRRIHALMGQLPGGVPAQGGGGSAQIEARAAGGMVGAGRPYLVGEAGPELFIPGGSGVILPNRTLSGGGMTIRGGTFHVYGVQDADSLYDALREIAGQRAG